MSESEHFGLTQADAYRLASTKTNNETDTVEATKKKFVATIEDSDQALWGSAQAGHKQAGGQLHDGIHNLVNRAYLRAGRYGQVDMAAQNFDGDALAGMQRIAASIPPINSV